MLLTGVNYVKKSDFCEFYEKCGKFYFHFIIDELEKIIAMNRCQELAMNRITHILNQKLRGGYDSSCLLLVAYAEVAQLLYKSGNELLAEIDTRYKKYSAYRPMLKKLTSQSKVLAAIR